MLKQNVFLVSGRNCSADGSPRGNVVNYVVCGADDQSVRSFTGKEIPDFAIVSLTSLVLLEERVKKIKAVLARTDTSWSVLIDPGLK